MLRIEGSKVVKGAGSCPLGPSWEGKVQIPEGGSGAGCIEHKTEQIGPPSPSPHVIVCIYTYI